MGNLLGTPVIDKETHVGATEDGSLKYGVSSMQGWRVHMEDAHIMESKLYAVKNTNNSSIIEKIAMPGHALFSVMDGHGGTFAAAYSGRNLCRVLSMQPSWVKYAEFVAERAEKEQTLSATDKAAYVKEGLDYLEMSMREALVALDREIALAVKGTKVLDADTPYHPSDTTDDTSTSDNSKKGIVGTVAEKAHQVIASEEGDSGTTICIVIITPDWIVCANAGDSRAVLSRAGKVLPLSYDHKPDDDAEEKRIRAAGGYVAGGRVDGDLAVSRGLGDFRFKDFDVVMAGNDRPAEDESHDDGHEPLPLPDDQKVSPIPDIIVQNRNPSQDEFVIIACDGIWDVQTNYEAVKAVTELFKEGESDLGLICEEMCDTGLSMGSKDNMTTLVIKFEAQKVESGGGVSARRQLRDSENKSKDDETAS